MQSGPEPDRWPFSAVYTPARAIGEGTAMAGWLLYPDADRSERVYRGAALTPWSDPGGWTEIVEAAGLEVRRDRLPDGREGPPYVWTGTARGRSRWAARPASCTAVASRAGCSAGASCCTTIRACSALAPRSGWASRAPSSVRSLARTTTWGLARDLAGMLRTEGERQAAYWGVARMS
jgi:hypothetical protein